jgi:Tfp pilus assembly protein PilP
MNARAVLVVLTSFLAPVGVSGCSEPRDDLEAYIASVKQDQSARGKVPPLPAVHWYSPKPLSLERDPFAPLKPASLKSAQPKTTAEAKK